MASFDSFSVDLLQETEEFLKLGKKWINFLEAK
jgi:hypothetical protein